MTHEAVDLIDSDDARLLIDEAVAANGTQDLGVGQCLEDRIAFQFMEAEDTRLNRLTRSPRQVHIGRAIEKSRPRAAAGTQSGNFIGQITRNLLHDVFVSESR